MVANAKRYDGKQALKPQLQDCENPREVETGQFDCRTGQRERERVRERNAADTSSENQTTQDDRKHMMYTILLSQ